MGEVERAGFLMDLAVDELSYAYDDIEDGLFVRAAERIGPALAHLMVAQALLVSEVGGVE